MGIQGLLPFLKSVSKPASIKDYKGCTVAIDSYCWLHKGAFSCADKLALGEKTDQYVYYCMKYVNNLLSYGIKPIMVFDGCSLPSKKEVEQTRRERREVNRKKAAQFLREGKKSEARECLQRCIDITPQMALALMKACRAKGVDCIVAPYEADSQLAYLNKCGIAQIIITEDSDLLLFGCEKVMFKMDFAGNGVMIEKKDLHKAMGLREDLFTFEKFRYMCILSGCDYQASLPGIGLGKANKLFQITRQDDVNQVLKKLPSTLKMSSLTVSSQYIKGFFQANNTFLYQLVYDPMKRKLVPLNPYVPEVNPSEMEYAGPYIEAKKAYQIALGNIDLYTGEVIAKFDPDQESVNGRRNNKDKMLHMLSIWNKAYRPMPKIRESHQIETERVPTKGKEVTVTTPSLLQKKRSPKRKLEQLDSDEDEKENDLLSAYTEQSSPDAKRPRLSDQLPSLPSDLLESKDSSLSAPSSSQARKTPPKPSHNVFAIKGKLDKGSFSLNGPKKLVKSRFFGKSEPQKPEKSFLDKEPVVEHTTDKSQSSFNCTETEIFEEKPKEKEKIIDAIENCQNSNTKLNNHIPIKNSPHGSFGFEKKMDLFKTSFDQNLTKINCSPKTTAQFKPIKPAKEKLHDIDSKRESNTLLITDQCDAEMELSDEKQTGDKSQLHLSSDSQKADMDDSRIGRESPESANKEQSGYFYTKSCEGLGVGEGSLVDLTDENSNDTSKSLVQKKQEPVLTKTVTVKAQFGGCRTSGLSKKTSKSKLSKENGNQKLTNFFSKFSFGGSEKPKIGVTKKKTLPLSPSKDTNTVIDVNMDQRQSASSRLMFS